MEHKPPTAVIESAHGKHALPFDDRTDFDNADRGFIAALSPCVIKAADGRVVWDNDVYSFLSGPAPTSVHPSLWRQSTLNAKQGLYEVVPGVYQVRGFDLSNISFIEGDTGIIVIDPLVSTEVAAAALDLYRSHRGGDRPVVAVIYTHSHVDHFGGVLGVTSQADVDAGKVAVLAPEGFTEHAVQENVYAGPAMTRRATYMYGSLLARGPHEQVGCGLGQTPSTGEVAVIVPTIDITTTGETHTIDGVEIEFQMAPGTEAPAEMHFYFPRFRALCMAENATHNLHNLLTLRGALVRDPHAWSGYLTEAIDTFADRTDVVFASHHWPTWGRESIVEFLSLQRDLYAYLHDQTLRLLNQGHTGVEIAEMFQMPPALERAWHTRGYYGSVSHNVKAVYQRYMGWFDGNPARLWPHPPEALAPRYVEALGGLDRVVELAQAGLRFGRLPLGGNAARSRDLHRQRARRPPASCTRTRWSSWATAPRTRRGATSSCLAPPNCATAISAPPCKPPRRRCWRSSRPSRSSTAWRSGSTGRAAGTSTSPSTSPSPISAANYRLDAAQRRPGPSQGRRRPGVGDRYGQAGQQVSAAGCGLRRLHLAGAGVVRRPVCAADAAGCARRAGPELQHRDAVAGSWRRDDLRRAGTLEWPRPQRRVDAADAAESTQLAGVLTRRR